MRKRSPEVESEEFEIRKLLYLIFMNCSLFSILFFNYQELIDNFLSNLCSSISYCNKYLLFILFKLSET